MAELADGELGYNHVVDISHCGEDVDVILIVAALHLVHQRVEKVVSLGGSFPGILLPKDKIDPGVQVLSHLRGLKGIPHLEHKLLCSLGPFGELNVVHLSSLLLLTQQKLVSVLQELRPVVELGDELFDVTGVGCGRHVLLLDPRKKPIRVVNLLSLVIPVQRDEWFESDEEVVHHRRV